MPRTTLDLDSSVLEDLRRRGACEHKSMGALASELLARQLEADEAETEPKPFKWIGRDLGMPRVDLEDKDAVWAILDGAT
jgi:hypothetical protein